MSFGELMDMSVLAMYLEVEMLCHIVYIYLADTVKQFSKGTVPVYKESRFEEGFRILAMFCS